MHSFSANRKAVHVERKTVFTGVSEHAAVKARMFSVGRELLSSKHVLGSYSL